MPLPINGEISYDEINVELGNLSGSEASMDAMTAVVDINCNINIPGTPDFISDWYSYSHVGLPSKPTVVFALAGPASIKVTWVDNSSDEDGFLVFRRTGNVNPPDGSWTQQTDEAANTVEWFDPTTPISGTFYQYYVCSHNCQGSNCSTFSNVVTG